ncbi:hypothetical protein LHT11_06600 [Acetobacter indonesiensis]|uniref:hypothetical protein n=1 Tax=Acetobacter indonesiensis TaxID=104101 RepID=UPI001F40B649|nr:hypothetical protein [Acetobacter indonesiensis]
MKKHASLHSGLAACLLLASACVPLSQALAHPGGGGPGGGGGGFHGGGGMGGPGGGFRGGGMVVRAAALEEAPEWGRGVEASEEVAGVAVFVLAEVLAVVSVVVRVWAPVVAFVVLVGGVVPVAGAAVGDQDAALAGVVALVGVGVAGDIPTITGAGVIPVGGGVQALMLAVAGVGAGELPSFSGLPLVLL